MKRLLTLLLIMTALTSCNQKQDKTPLIGKKNISVLDGIFTPELMHSLGKISDPQVSPDGTKILYGVLYTSIEQNKSNRELFTMNIDGSDNKQITFTPKSESNARWIDGGAKIAYLHSGQLWIMNSDGSSPKKVSNIENGISEFKFSPDETKVLYVADFKVNKAPTDVYPDLEKASVRTIDGMMYRHWDHFVKTVPHSYIAPFNGHLGACTDILNGEPFELPAVLSVVLSNLTGALTDSTLSTPVANLQDGIMLSPPTRISISTTWKQRLVRISPRA